MIQHLREEKIQNLILVQWYSVREFFFILFHFYSFFVSRIDFPPTRTKGKQQTETASLCERSPWRLKAPSTRNRVKKTCGFKSSGESRPSDKGGGGEGGSSIKKKIFPALRASEKIRGEDPSLGSTTEKCPNSCRRGLAC